MVEYIPPPRDLSKLNPIQRYMQKGSLDFQDWVRLVALIALYWFARPYIMRLAKKWSGSQEGEEEAEAYRQRREQAAISNDIRSGKRMTDGKTLGQVLEEGADGFTAAEVSGANVPAAMAQEGEIKNRKQKKKGVSFAPEKTEEERTLDWEDESEFDPRKGPATAAQAQSGDIKAWMEKWTS